MAVGFAKGWLDFGNFILALWIRVRAGAALQMDLFRHLLGLSMRFFTSHRTGELVSRLESDTRSATGGLETIVGTVLTAPLLIGFYGWLMVRTSPTLVLAAVGGGGAALRRPCACCAGPSGAWRWTSSRASPTWRRASRRPS